MLKASIRFITSTLLALAMLSTSTHLYAASEKSLSLAKRKDAVLKRIIISDTAEKVNMLTFGSNNGRILVLDVKSLNDVEFSNLMKKYWDQMITHKLLDQLHLELNEYFRRKGISNIFIDYPEIDKPSNDLRVVVVLNSECLKTIYLSTPSRASLDFSYESKPGQIVIDDLPSYLVNSNFSNTVTQYFLKPITPEYVNRLIYSISQYVEKQGSYLAVAQIPEQNMKNGVLKLGLIIGNYPLRRLVVMGSPEKDAFTTTNDNSNSILVLNNRTYDTLEFRNYISAYLGKPITVKLLDEIKEKLSLYGKMHDRIVIDPKRMSIDLAKGEIRIGLVIGKYAQFHIKGNRWFSDEYIENQLGIKKGDEISLSQLDNAIAWENHNPFLQVQVALDSMNMPLGQANLDLDVKEAAPARFAVSYSNAINSPLGNSSYTGSAQFGNLFNLGHEFNYQYSTNNTPKYYQAHSVDYKAPLFWHDYLRLDFSYSLAYPHSILGYIGLNQKAKNTVADVRYIKPFTRGKYLYEVSGGIDYKQVNTNLQFGSFTEPVAVYDVAQLVIGATIIRKDIFGSWSLATNFSFSPGGLNYRNSKIAYETTIQGSSTGRNSLYEYGKFIFERDNNLPWNFQIVSRVTLQASSTNLQGSEQLLIGGGASVRGYSQSYTADQGFIFNEEIRSPYFQTKIPFTHNKRNQLNTQLIGFFDYGRIAYKHPMITDIIPPSLMGTGIGIRSSLYGTFSLGSDMSWPLLHTNYNDPHPTKGTFWMTLAY